MAINKIPHLSINGAGGDNQRSIFGGYIYQLNYDVKMGNEGTSSVIANIVSEDGTYSISNSDLNLSRTYTITIGSNISLPMYLKRYKKITSPRGNLLEIEFVDGSFLMDTLFVGLHNKHGCNPDAGGDCPEMFDTNIDGCMIIVGKMVNPCDRYYNGQIDNIQNFLDPCHPCNKDESELASARLKIVDCKDMVKYDILKVRYNFGELISKIVARGINLVNAFDPNPQYYAEYTGSLRSVLSSFCSDFGWIFFWENNSIVFKDLRTTINVNTTISNFCPNLAEYEEEYTLEGTFQATTITNYGRAGKNREYKCQDAVHIAIPSFNKSNVPTSSLGISALLDETASGLSRYDRRLRDLWYWFDKYNMRDGTQIAPGNNLKELGVTILSNPISLGSIGGGGGLQTGGLSSSTLDPSTSLDQPAFVKDPALVANTIIDLDFMTADLSQFPDLENVRTAIEGNDSFLKCFELLPAEEQWKAAKDINNKYFFIAYYDESVDAEFYKSEQDFAENFMGKFHVFLPNLFDEDQKNFFEDWEFIADDTTCSNQRIIKQDSRIKFEFLNETKGDSLKYYNNMGVNEEGDIETLVNMPFAKYLSIFRDQGDTPLSAAAQRDFKLVCVEKASSWFPGVGTTNPDDDPDNIPQHTINNDKLIGLAHSYYPKQLGIRTDERGEDMIRVILQNQNITSYDRNKNKMHIFMGTRCAQGDFIVSKAPGANPETVVGVPFNGIPLNPNDDPDPSRRHEVIYQYPNLQCMSLGNESNQSNIVYFKTPSGLFSYYEPSYTNYGVVIQKTRDSYQKLRKFESVYTTGACASPNVMALKINYRDITDQDINVIGRLPDTTSCAFSKDLVEQVHEFYAENTETSQEEPLIKKSFTVAGIDIGVAPTINDGLLNLQITVDDNGVKSHYIFGTVRMIPPSKPEVYGSQIQAILANAGVRATADAYPIQPTPAAPNAQTPGQFSE